MEEIGLTGETVDIFETEDACDVAGAGPGDIAETGEIDGAALGVELLPPLEGDRQLRTSLKGRWRFMCSRRVVFLEDL